jgi:vitamin B12 transporter
VVTATRIKEPRKDISASVQIITQEDIKNSTAKNVGDLLAEAGIGHIHKYPGALTARIGLRGFSTDLFSPLKSRVLILINGHYAGTANLAKIPVSDIERIEIVKGPASVLYGSQAMGGVINIITKKAKEEGIYGFVGIDIGSWDYWKTEGEGKLKKGPFEFYLSVSRSSRDNFKSKNYGEIENTAYNDESLSFRLGYTFLEKHHISIGMQHWRGWDIGSPGARYSPDPDNFSNKERNGIEVGYSFRTLKIDYYLVKNEDEWHGGMTKGPGTSSITITKTDTMGASIQNTFNIGPVRLVTGTDWIRVKVTSSRNIGAPYNPNSRYNTYGIFAEARTKLIDQKLLLNIGLRYDYFKNEILSTHGLEVNPKEEDIDHITVRGGVVYLLTDTLRIRTNIGTAFRAPAPDELATDYISSWGTHYLGNPELAPEKSISYEAGFEFSDKRLRIDFTAFHSKFKDKILRYYDKNLSVRTWKNVDGATIQGWELYFSYNLGAAAGWSVTFEPFTHITYHTKYTAKDEEEISQYGKILLYTPKWTGTFGIKAMGEDWDIRLIAIYNGKEKVIDWNYLSLTFGDTIEKEDFTVVNIKGSYRPYKNLEITASIENLFNKAYEYVIGYPMPERTFTAGIKFIF